MTFDPEAEWALMAQMKPCPTSSRALKSQIANFMERADEIAASPLAVGDALTLYPVSQRVEVGWDPDDKAGFNDLAVLLRPIVFRTGDPIDYLKLTGAIGREHHRYGKWFRGARKEYLAWETTSLVPEHPDLGTDLDCSNLYLNTCVYHADGAKSETYYSATPNQRLYYRTCAQLHTLTAVPLVATPGPGQQGRLSRGARS